ncbi:MAG: pyridoxamine 5'-phosphate oxidase family protein [Pseudomonadota bacterium]
MRPKFAELMFTDAVKAQQEARGSREYCEAAYKGRSNDGIGPDEKDFIETRDSFYMSTVNADGWPYVQHRGGPPGFLKVLGPDRIGFADYRGNRQFVSTGNVAGDDRVSLFLMDYARKARMKILGHAEIVEAADDPDLGAKLTLDGAPEPERLMTIRLAAYDWNCPKYITTRLTEPEINQVLGPRFHALKTRIAELEAALAAKEGS